MNSEEKWLQVLKELRPASGRGRSSGKAPHKPLLLLSLLDAFEDGEISNRVFTKTPNLVVRFLNYSAITAERWPGKLKIGMPFFHLSSQGVWKSFNQEMQPATADSAMLNEFDAEFFDLCQDGGFRTKARMILISTYFSPPEKVALFTAVGLGSQRDAEAAQSLVQDVEANAQAERKGRSSRFRSDVVIKYHRTCALTGYRCDTVDGSSIVDAAHIDAFSRSQNDNPDNGLALSKNAHWMFDQGLWVIGDDLRIIVNDSRYSEAGPDTFLLRSFDGRHLQFDPNSKLRPDLENIRNHRMKHAS